MKQRNYLSEVSVVWSVSCLKCQLSISKIAIKFCLFRKSITQNNNGYCISLNSSIIKYLLNYWVHGQCNFLKCYGFTCVASTDGDVETEDSFEDVEGCLTGVYINSVYYFNTNETPGELLRIFARDFTLVKITVAMVT